jgi:hypothetical protein
MEDLLENPAPAATTDPVQKARKPERRIVVSDQEWVSLIVRLYRKIRPNLSIAVCLGKYTDVNTLHKAYTGAVTLNPLYLTREQAVIADTVSRHWIANIQAVGDRYNTYRELLDNCMVTMSLPGHVLVITDQPQEALKLFDQRYRPLIVSPRPVPGHLGSFTLRHKNRDYAYFFNAGGRCKLEYESDHYTSPHHVLSSDDVIDKIYVNFQQSDLHENLKSELAAAPGQCEIIPLQYLDTQFNLNDQSKVTVPASGVPQVSELAGFFLKLMPELMVYNPVEMRETSLYTAIRNPLLASSIGYEETVALYRLLGLDFPDNPESRRRMEKQADFYRQQTVPMIKPTGDQLLAYYKPGYYTAQKDVFFAIGKKKVPAFAQGKKYYVYPIQHSEVIELPEAQLLEAEDGDETKAKLTRRNMSLHCTYTALAMTSELKPSEIHGYSQQNGQAYKVITADEYELARQIQQAAAMGNPGKVDELKKRLKALYGRRIHITSKDPNLTEVLQAFPPPEIKTLSEAYPEQLKGRIELLSRTKAPLTDIQILHAGLASLKRGAVLTHHVGSGKTRIAACAAIAGGARRVAFIAKSKILGEIIKELRDELGLDVTHIHSPSCIRKLREEVNRGTKPDHTKFYVISQEFLTIGGLANQTFDPYPVDLKELDNGNERIHPLICTRENAEKQIKGQILKLREEQVITGEVKRVPFHFHQHVQECPRCLEAAAQRFFHVSKNRKWIQLSCATRQAIREQIVEFVKRGKVAVGLREFGTFSRHGHCRVCGYLARSYQRVQNDAPEEVAAEVADLLAALGDEEKPRKGDQGFRSALQFPAYRLLKNLFDTKICDEAHSLTGESKVYEAVKSIHTRRTYLLSGTLLRRTPAEMWQIFTLLWGYRSPEFPYAYDQQNEFIEQHVTFRVTRDAVHDPQGKKIATRHNKQEMPEPANAPKLWKYLHQAQLHATSRGMGLKIPDVRRHFLAIPMENAILDEYEEVLRAMKLTFVADKPVFSLTQRRDWFTQMAELQAIALKAKVKQLMTLAQEMVASGRNLIVAAKQQKTYELLVQLFTEAGFDFVKLDEKRPAQPHKRREWIDEHYVRSRTPIFLTRTPLINESLNNLVKASAIIVVEAEYVFYPLQQLEGRIARPKQKAPVVDVTYMVTQHPQRASIDEAMLQMALRRNNANVELVSGNVTQRTNEQLVEMAETQKMRELELMQTLLAEARPAKVSNLDYQAEFAAREAEIEAAERAKAVIVVKEDIREQLDKSTAESAPAANGPPPQATEPMLAPSATTPMRAPPTAALGGIQTAVNGKNLELDLALFPSCVEGPQPATRQRSAMAIPRAGRLGARENLTLQFDE